MNNLINIIIYLPLYLYYAYKGKTFFLKEANNWIEKIPGIVAKPSTSMFFKRLRLIAELREFRSLMYFKIKTHKFNPIKKIYKQQEGLFFDTKPEKIGSGLIIQHGFSTIINAESIGVDAQIWHGVTIGKSRSGLNSRKPIIGNNVKVCCHAIVLGGITIGDNVTIGAGSVVVKDVPPNCIVVGNPARIIKS